MRKNEKKNAPVFIAIRIQIDSPHLFMILHHQSIPYSTLRAFVVLKHFKEPTMPDA